MFNSFLFLFFMFWSNPIIFRHCIFSFRRTKYQWKYIFSVRMMLDAISCWRSTLVLSVKTSHVSGPRDFQHRLLWLALTLARSLVECRSRDRFWGSKRAFSVSMKLHLYGFETALNIRVKQIDLFKHAFKEKRKEMFNYLNRNLWNRKLSYVVIHVLY